MKVIALDIGSSSVKAGYWDGRHFARVCREGYRTVFDGARVEVSPKALLAALAKAARGAAGGKPVDAVAYCTFSPGVVVTNERYEARTPIIMHSDRRSSTMALELVKRRTKRWWLERTGNLPYAGSIGSSTLAWLKKHDARVLKACRVGQVSTLVGAYLTGEWRIDRSQAAFLGLWDIRKDAWSKEVCDVVGVAEESLPALHDADEVTGKLTAAAARGMGLAAGVPVIGGFVDTSAAVIQTPMRSGQLSHNAGSTDVLAMCVPGPQPAEGILSRPVGVSGRLSGSKARPWLAVRTIASAGSAMAWVRERFFGGMADGAWGKLVGRVCRELDVEGVRCVPSFVGERASMVQPSGAEFSGVRLDTDGEEILRSVVRGLVEESAKNHSLLARVHKPERRVFAMGGASALGDAMHRGWSGRHSFERLEGEGMSGLVLLATKVMGSSIR